MNKYMTMLKEIASDRISYWSMDPYLLLAQEPALEGEVKIVYRLHWGETYPEKVVSNPTYADLWDAAEQLIRESGDGHHTFIENFIPVKEEGDNVWELITGS